MKSTIVACLGAWALVSSVFAATITHKVEVMLPADAYCDTAVNEPATLFDDGVGAQSSHFQFPNDALLFDAHDDQYAHCWFQLPAYFNAAESVELQIVGHAHLDVNNSGDVDFELRMQEVARDEDMWGTWGSWQGTSSGSFDIAISSAPGSYGEMDYSKRTDSTTLTETAVAGDVLMFEIRRDADDATNDDFTGDFAVDYLILRFGISLSGTVTP